MITWPDTYDRYLLEFESYRTLWLAYCIHGDYWYKGTGPDRQSAIDDLGKKVASGTRIGKPLSSRFTNGEYRHAPINPELLSNLNLNELDL